MERLTHMSDGYYAVDSADCWEDQNEEYSGPAIDRLAAYEDTGLEPDAVEAMKNVMMGKAIAEIKEFNGIPINHLCELVQAENDGRLVMLPCKVGDKVYVVNGLWVSQYIISRFWYDGLFFNFKASNEEYAEDCCNFSFFDERIGKTVFLTREEAEAALEAQKGMPYETNI